MDEQILPEELLSVFRYAIAQARKDPPGYIDWIKNEVNTVINLINQYDKIYIIGALGAKLIEASPNMHNQFLADYDGPDKDELEGELMIDDEHAEVLLEYVMSIALATPNVNKGNVPTQENIDLIYDQLKKIQTNFSFLELSKNLPEEGDSANEWIKNSIIQDNMNIRGNGFHQHVSEVYLELFAPYDDFLRQFYGFDSKNILDTIFKWDDLIMSKVGSLFGSIKSHDRFKRWGESIGGEEEVLKQVGEQMRSPFAIYAEANPDLTIAEHGMGVIHYPLNYIEGYPKVFWVIPENDIEKRIFERLSSPFDNNANFFIPPQYKAFIMNDSIIRMKPLVKEDDKYYHFSIQLAFRNMFKITENLIKEASLVYYEANFRNNSNTNSRDNYIESKARTLFERIVPTAAFYSSVDYFIDDNGTPKKTELDLLGISDNNIFIIEVKAGELNDKHRRGALKGLKDRLGETIDYGSYQCDRAKKFIENNETARFEYSAGGKRHNLDIKNSDDRRIFKITLTFEHFAAISVNLQYLVESGVLNDEYKWVWIISLFDLMIFADLIDNEQNFVDYLENRLSLYERNDISFSDEIDILGFFLGGHFPLPAIENEKVLTMTGFGEEIDNYYTRTGVGMPYVEKPKKK